MSRRHTNTSTTQWNPLTDPYLLFYAPMTQGDLTDHISNTDLQGYDNTKVVWDSTYNMYQVMKQSQADEMYWNVNLLYNATTNPYGMQLSSSQGYTIYVFCKRELVVSNNYPPYIIMGSYRLESTFSPSVASIGQEDNFSLRELLLGRAIVHDIGGKTFYKDISNGLVTNVHSENSSGRLNPQNWVTDNYSRIAINPKRGNEDPDMSIWVKTVLVYSRALTDNELRIINTSL